jgi:hypothetical protein
VRETVVGEAARETLVRETVVGETARETQWGRRW